MWPAISRTGCACDPRNHHSCQGLKIWPVVGSPLCTSDPPDPASANGASSTAATPPDISSAFSLPPGSASSTGPAATRAHCLFAIASPSRAPAHSGRPRIATSTAATHRTAPSNSSGCPYLQRAQRQRVCDAQRQRERRAPLSSDRAPSFCATSHTPRIAARDQAGSRRGPENRKLAATPQLCARP